MTRRMTGRYIRRLIKADCDVIADLEASLFATALDQPRLHALLKNPVFYGLVTVAPKDDTPNFANAALAEKHRTRSHLTGYILATIIADEAEIISIAVDPDHQGRGIAGDLLLQFMTHCRTFDVAVITLEVAADNLPALGLYRQHGFAEFGLRKGYYRHGNQKTDAIMMKCRITEAFS
ncbi:MAG: ribosomal protein S18-alanine N-acetyltransferase [Candidatus Puniceispirillaceae bacterium]|jgi:ribosomal-protein-alanine acetyltransferase